MEQLVDRNWIFDEINNRLRLSDPMGASFALHISERELISIICEAPDVDAIPTKDVYACIIDMYELLQKISDNCRKHDFSLFRINGIGGCDMYQGLPPIKRVLDSLLDKHESVICSAYREKEKDGTYNE